MDRSSFYHKYSQGLDLTSSIGCLRRYVLAQLDASHCSSFVINTRAQRRLLRTLIMLVIVKQHTVHNGRSDGPSEHVIRQD